MTYISVGRIRPAAGCGLPLGYAATVYGEVTLMEIKALVADSSNQVRKNIARSLKEIGVRNVVEANDSKQALEQLKKGKFDVIFTEFNTTAGPNEEMLKTFRKMNANVPIIVTAPQTQNVAELKKSCPTATTYMTTPFTTDQLSQDGFAIRTGHRWLNVGPKELGHPGREARMAFLFAFGHSLAAVKIAHVISLLVNQRCLVWCLAGRVRDFRRSSGCRRPVNRHIFLSLVRIILRRA